MAVDAKKPLLVLINPYSGTKLASKLFRTVVKPELDQRRLLYEVLETEYAGKIEIGSMTIFYTEVLTRKSVRRAGIFSPPNLQVLLVLMEA